jgi:hypothetical protein
MFLGEISMWQGIPFPGPECHSTDFPSILLLELEIEAARVLKSALSKSLSIGRLLVDYYYIVVMHILLCPHNMSITLLWQHLKKAAYPSKGFH